MGVFEHPEHRWIDATEQQPAVARQALWQVGQSPYQWRRHANEMKFGQLILKKIMKIVATRCQILRLKCTKIDSGGGLCPRRRWGSLECWNKKDLLLGEGDGCRNGEGRSRGRERRERGEGREEEGIGGKVDSP